ncbi:MAG: hypothetical protein V2A70_00200 [Candidatus Omnitrophota bacterium]
MRIIFILLLIVFPVQGLMAQEEPLSVIQDENTDAAAESVNNSDNMFIPLTPAETAEQNLQRQILKEEKARDAKLKMKEYQRIKKERAKKDSAIKREAKEALRKKLQEQRDARKQLEKMRAERKKIIKKLKKQSKGRRIKSH